jgi:hypothetical protein
LPEKWQIAPTGTTSVRRVGTDISLGDEGLEKIAVYCAPLSDIKN